MSTTVDANNPNWQLTTRVLHSAIFEKSPRLRSFLEFICELELTGRHSEINEQQVGIQVFGRPAGYNPGEDSIVRSQARFLRQRLEKFFRTDGRDEPIRIVIPKGSYVPVFEPNIRPTPEVAQIAVAPVLPSDAAMEPNAAAPSVQIPARRRRIGWRIAVSLVATLLVCAVGFLLFQGSFRSFQSPETRFWNAIFDPRRPPIIVPADSTLILIEEITGQNVSFQSYLSRDYMANLSLPKCITTLSSSDLESSHYTSMADLNLVSRLMEAPNGKRLRPTVRYARDLSIAEAKEQNLILVGGPRANPWVELFANSMNFYVDYDPKTHHNFVVDKAPLKGESQTYIESSMGASHQVYGLISFQPSLDREGDALLVAGTSSAGTQTAADFLLSGRAFAAYLLQIQRKDGSIPHFELLLEARSVGGNVTGSTVVASRIVP